MKSYYYLVLYALAACCLVHTAYAQSRTPVVFIPGFAGSYLCAKSDGKRVWPGSLDHRSIRLPMESALDFTRLAHVPCGIVREPIRLAGFRVSDVYGKFVDYIRSQLAPDIRLIEFSYDWRLTTEHNARRLQEQLDRELPGQAVDIVAHSFGGLVTRYFIRKLGGANRVRKLITMGTPHLGSVDTFESLYDGWGRSSFTDRAVTAWMGGTAEIRRSLLSFPGFYDMLPNYSKCCWFVHGQGIADEEFNPFDSRAWSRFSFYDELFSHAPDKAFLDFQLKRAWRLHRDVLSASLPAPHDTTQRLIVTGWIKTITRVLIDSHTGGRLPFIRNDGDGTVPLHSAAEGREVDDKLLHYSPGEHMQIFNQTAALEIVKRTLTGGTSPVGGNTPNLTIVTNDRRIDVKSLQYKIAPGAVHPDETLSLTIRLVGEDGLAQADLSGITAAFEGESGATELTLRRDAEMQNHSDRVTLISEFLAPKIPGAYIVRIHIPGFAEDYKDVFLVAAN